MKVSANVGLGASAPPEDTLLGLANADERFLTVIAAAAPFDERESGQYFTPVRRAGRRRLAERSQRWLRAAVGDDEVSRRALLLHRQRTGRDLGAGLVDVAVRDPGRLPAWAYALVDFLLAQPASAEVDPATELVGGVFVSFHRAAARLTGARNGRLRGVALTREAADDVHSQAVHRLIVACQSALAFEMQIADGTDRPVDWYSRAGVDVSRAGWLARLESLPGLAYVIGVICLNYKRVVAEVFDRLREDLPALRRELWAWADPGPVSAYSGDSGDLHNHGRTVTLLTFAGGQRVVYKPKDLASVAGFMDVLTFLNTHGLSRPLATRKVLRRDGYGWEEFVTARPCQPGEDAGVFYQRLGMFACLAELLECRDLWADNLVAVGDQPVFIDLENVLQPRMRKPSMLGDRAAALWHEIEESTAKTAMLSYPRVGTPGTLAQDIGCAAPLQEQLAANSEGFPPGWEAPPYRPVVDGRLADPAAYGDEIQRGYREMRDCVSRNLDGLVPDGGPLHLLATARVRYIWRSTWDYMSVLALSTSPLALTDGIARELVLARLFRGARESLGVDPERNDCLELIEREIEGLRGMDVPLFQSEPGNGAVWTPDGARVDNHFAGTAWDRLQQRLAALRERPDPRREAILDTLLDFAAGGRPVWTPAVDDAAGDPDPRRAGLAIYHPDALRPTVPHEDLLAAACAAADEIIAAAVPVGAGRHGWIGVVHYPAFGLDQVEPLHGDVLTGTAGLAVFLAELYQTTGKPTYWAFTQDALSASREFVQVAERAGAYLRMSGGRRPVGAFVGLGATLYALARCGIVTEDQALLSEAYELMALARDVVAQDGTGSDVLDGRAGLLLALLKLRTGGGAPELDGFVAELYDGLLAGLDQPRHRAYPGGVPLLDALPTGEAGVLLALSRAQVALDRTADRERLAERYGRLAPRTAGGYLAATAVSADLGLPLPVPPERAAPPTGMALLDQLELSLARFRVSGDEAHRDAGHRAVRAMLARRTAHGRWFPDRRRADRLQLSAVDGLAAVGLACLALAEEDVSSLRLID